MADIKNKAFLATLERELQRQAPEVRFFLSLEGKLPLTEEGEITQEVSSDAEEPYARVGFSCYSWLKGQEDKFKRQLTEYCVFRFPLYPWYGIGEHAVKNEKGDIIDNEEMLIDHVFAMVDRLLKPKAADMTILSLTNDIVTPCHDYKRNR